MRKFIFIFLCLIFVSQLYAQELKLIGGINYSSYAIHPEVVVFPWFPPNPPEERHYERNKAYGYLFGVGIEFSLVLSHKENGLSITENTKIFDLGIILGGGVEIKMPKNALLIEGRYHIGLINIAKDDWRFDSIKTNSLVLILAFKI
ncbi:hypothetical protein KA005_29330 [bacterium]|nr:hypothetical protein [bacterium]